MLRLAALLAAVILLATGLTLGYIAIVAVRRNEGVFLPAGYVAVMCLTGAFFLLRATLRP